MIRGFLDLATETDIKTEYIKSQVEGQKYEAEQELLVTYTNDLHRDIDEKLRGVTEENLHEQPDHIRGLYEFIQKNNKYYYQSLSLKPDMGPGIPIYRTTITNLDIQPKCDICQPSYEPSYHICDKCTL